MINAPFIIRLHAYTLSKLVDGNYTGLDLFYHIKDCWKGRDTPSDILLKPLERGLPYKIGQWCFQHMTETELSSASSNKAYYLQLPPEELVWFLEDFVETAVHAGIPSDDSLIQKFRTIFEKTDHLFEEGFGKGEQAYWDYIEREARTKLRGLYRTLIRENGTAVESMKDAYAVEISDRIVHDRQLCAFIAQLLLQIGFDGENLRGVPEQWVKRGTWPASIKRIIAARDRGKCAECSVDILQELEADAHLDHIVPISRGGCNDIVNLQLLCARCNRKKRDQDRDVRSSVPRYIKRQAKG